MLGAGLAFNQSFFFRTVAYAAVSRDAHDIRHDWQRPKLSANFVKHQPDLRAARYTCRLHTPDVPANLAATRVIASTICRPRCQGPVLKKAHEASGGSRGI